MAPNYVPGAFFMVAVLFVFMSEFSCTGLINAALAGRYHIFIQVQ